MSGASALRYVARVLADADRTLASTIPAELQRYARAYAYADLCSRMHREHERRVQEKRDLLLRELASLEELQAARDRWGELLIFWWDRVEDARVAFIEDAASW